MKNLKKNIGNALKGISMKMKINKNSFKKGDENLEMIKEQLLRRNKDDNK